MVQALTLALLPLVAGAFRLPVFDRRAGGNLHAHFIVTLGHV